MKVQLVQALLALAVLAAWLGVAGFLRLASPLDRLHCVTFANVTCGVSILIAAALWDGSPEDVIKLALLLGALLVGGAAIAHATARAIVRRRAAR
ncbi:MAG TPA: monovalent cation/H(+) antiporter subunit G [Steroidobacteraceae bacterium]